jgi:UDP-3-O-[3-hydroxymyristoyl] N-acetylglucosamine deacetylase
MTERPYGRVLQGSDAAVAAAYERFQRQPVDWEWMPDPESRAVGQTTLRAPVAVTGPGTFFRRALRTLHFEPATEEGWWFERTDLPDALPIRVAVNNVWTTVRNIVLRSGSPHNYMRMVEHIVALRNGLGIDNVVIRMDSGDPPLFERGSLDLVEALERAGSAILAAPPRYVTVKEPVTVQGTNGGFLTFRPGSGAAPALDIDGAIDFPTAIGRQRLRVRVTPETFRYGALARTNCSLAMMIYAKTIGQLFADTRNLGYTTKNILIAGRWGYYNQPALPHNGKSLEAVWHRIMLDLLAVVALIDAGRFVGEIVSYKSGHALDVAMVRHLYQQKLLVEA